jgi:hypothetical protein
LKGEMPHDRTAGSGALVVKRAGLRLSTLRKTLHRRNTAARMRSSPPHALSRYRSLH